MEGRPGFPMPSDQRRIQNESDNSMPSRSTSLELALRDNLNLNAQLESEAARESPEVTLKRMLSTKSIVSTSSSFAQRQQGAIGTNAPFREIGVGSIGKVFEHPGTIFVYKLPVSDPSKLWNNYVMHKRVQHSFMSLPYLEGQVEVPCCFWYGSPSTQAFWDEHLDRFPETPEFPRKPRHVLCMERIFPLPRPVRHALIDKYCPPKGKDLMKANEANKDCLVRPCLGRLKYGTGGQFFSLRNFKLHSDQIKDLDLANLELSIGMAHALAVLHWHTKIDAKDVEFVLGSSPIEEQKVRNEVDIARVMSMRPHTSTYEEATHTKADFTKRITSLWMLDFDDCGDITRDNAGVDKAVKAFLETNFYCPKPNTGNPFIETTWKDFAKRYVQYSHFILEKVLNQPELKHLPIQFIGKICQKTAIQRRQGQENPQIRPPRRGGGEGSPSNMSSRRGSHTVESAGWGRGSGHGSPRRGDSEHGI